MTPEFEQFLRGRQPEGDPWLALASQLRVAARYCRIRGFALDVQYTLGQAAGYEWAAEQIEAVRARNR